MTPRLLELLPAEAAALEVVLGVDVDPVVSVTDAVASVTVLPVGVAVLETITLSPFTGQPKTVKVDPAGTTVDVIVHDQVLPSVSGILNWSSHVSDC